ncbi:hypothetical protein HELRODRAFT_193513 [Helobdella robusta]|uniref:O-acyltransferase n=1 Tax=Helobdella robusta TaxID=6412 RepID=T1FV26_HELRO|nr:hypothetical protein HELRODRAFT_193513 [Helobdella robusta]ESN95456.1 hypothetical protein HELRODRAFT_193513 [Helobdella robusta]
MNLSIGAMKCHRVRESLLSTSSGFQNFRGLLNWCGVMLLICFLIEKKTYGKTAVESNHITSQFFNYMTLWRGFSLGMLQIGAHSQANTPDRGRCFWFPLPAEFNSRSGRSTIYNYNLKQNVSKVFTMGRAALENVLKYGILIDPVNWYLIFIRSPSNFPIIWILIALLASIAVTFLIEKLASKNYLSEGFVTFLHALTLGFIIVFPAVIVLNVHPHPFISSPLLAVCIIVFLKMSSYAQTNKWCRKHQLKKENQNCKASCLLADKPANHKSPRLRSLSIRADLNAKLHEMKQVNDDYDSNYSNLMVVTQLQDYPDNLNVKDLVYFLLVPTVCYELNYPRTTRIRHWFLINRALETLFLWGLVLSLIQQWIYPIISNSIVLFENMNYPMMVERILKLAVPNHLIWLITFYVIFHSWFNLLAELLRFGDRMFYKDWWNSENLQQFWSTWNIPIHRYALRHIYKPLLGRGVSKPVANTMVFIVSACFHEYLFSIPLNMFRFWFFASFMMQIPLVLLSSKLNGKLGNIIIWLMLVLGQPVALLMYSHDYYIAHHRNNTMVD